MSTTQEQNDTRTCTECNELKSESYYNNGSTYCYECYNSDSDSDSDDEYDYNHNRESYSDKENEEDYD